MANEFFQSPSRFIPNRLLGGAPPTQDTNKTNQAEPKQGQGPKYMKGIDKVGNIVDYPLENTMGSSTKSAYKKIETSNIYISNTVSNNC